LRILYTIVSMMKQNGIKLLFICSVAALASCNNKTTVPETSNYTKIDSLTETYLNLQDSLLITWNMMVKDENEKLRSMHELLHSMSISNLFDKSQLIALEQRLEQVELIRFNQKTMSNQHVVEEYDFASNSLITEILSLAETNSAFTQKKELQSLIDYIKVADQRVNFYRSEYDFIAQKFNLFVEKNKDQMIEFDQDSTNEKRPLFQMASDN
jgi:hypothetical protein